MNQCQAVGGVAVATHSRLGDAATIHLHTGAVGTHLALEKRLLHLGDKLRGTDHHAANSDQLINVCREQDIRQTEALVWSRDLTFYQQEEGSQKPTLHVGGNMLNSGPDTCVVTVCGSGHMV